MDRHSDKTGLPAEPDLLVRVGYRLETGLRDAASQVALRAGWTEAVLPYPCHGTQGRARVRFPHFGGGSTSEFPALRACEVALVDHALSRARSSRVTGSSQCRQCSPRPRDLPKVPPSLQRWMPSCSPSQPGHW